MWDCLISRSHAGAMHVSNLGACQRGLPPTRCALLLVKASVAFKHGPQHPSNNVQVTTRLEDVQAQLRQLVAAETLLVAHSGDNDLAALKVGGWLEGQGRCPG